MKNYFITNRRLGMLIVMMSLMGLISCKKGWLEENPDKKIVVPETLSDFQQLLDDFSTMGQTNPSLGEVASNEFYVISFVPGFPERGDAYLWTKTVPHTNVVDWYKSYEKILIDNIVLDGLEKSGLEKEKESQEWKDVKGQALFHRARVFFELAQIYAPLYNPNTADQDLGIVLRLSSDVSIPSKRSTVKQTYEQILKDLNEAKDLLPVRPKILTRGSASAVNALLARVYLSMEDYQASFIAANNCLTQYSQLLDYNDVSATATFIGLYNKEVLVHSNYVPAVSALGSNFVEKSFYDLYDQNDLRKTRFYRLNANQTISFKGSYTSVTSQYFFGIATDEMYLTRAECHARAGRTADALKDLNDLLIKRWNKNIAYQPLTANNAIDALKIILNERRKELIFRGTRWTDLRRLNKDPNFVVTLTRTVDGVTYTLEPNSYKYTFPIPDDIVQQTGMPQNPGWP